MSNSESTEVDDLAPQDHEEPTYGAGSFRCPSCGALTGQTWLEGVKQVEFAGLQLAQCQVSTCAEYTLWVGRAGGGRSADGDLLRFKRLRTEGLQPSSLHPPRMIWPPSTAVGPVPNQDMPDSARADFEEARRAIPVSPRGGCALARLALQKVCDDLAGSAGGIDANIKKLVADGLSETVQQALDAVRVIGNEAVHPGQLDLSDDRATATVLLELINYIVDERVTKPKTIKAIYETLPKSKRAAIDARDNKKP